MRIRILSLLIAELKTHILIIINTFQTLESRLKRIDKSFIDVRLQKNLKTQ